MRNTRAALQWITDILHDQNIPFEIDGGLAAHLYGVERELADIDINIPIKNFYNFIPLVKKYITYGPKRYKDAHWNTLMISLNYAGQNIDICALGETQYFDQENKKWIDFPSDLSSMRIMEYENMKLPVINEIKFMIYKKTLNRGVDRKDVFAMLKKLFSKKIKPNLTKVAFVYLKKDDKILLLQEGGKLAIGLWCFPGGHVDAGESFEQAAIREVKEESGYTAVLKNIIFKTTLPFTEYKGSRGDTSEIELVIYSGEITGGEMTQDNQALDIKWLTKEEAIKLPLRWNFLKDLILKKFL